MLGRVAGDTESCMVKDDMIRFMHVHIAEHPEQNQYTQAKGNIWPIHVWPILCMYSTQKAADTSLVKDDTQQTLWQWQAY